MAQDIQNVAYPLPKSTPNAYAANSLSLAGSNGDPTSFGARKNLSDGATSDPSDASGSPYNAANQYMMGVYTDYILPNKNPDLSLIWFRNPDSTEHAYGVGSANYKDALRSQDALLGQLQAKLTELGLNSTTNIIVVSDHGHSNVAGPATLYPLRAVAGGAVAGIDPNGYSVSGDVRLADLLARAGFTAYDGSGCSYDPVLSGIKADGSTVYPTQTDADGSICGTAGKKYTTASFKVPATLPAHALVIAANGGSDYVYVPDRDSATVQKVVSFLQSREEYGAIFVSKRYGNIPGTIPMDTIKVENSAGRNPDIIASFNFDENALVQGMKGTEFESMFGNRGMHGSFSPIDVHNTLIASGPDFQTGFVDTLPSGNVDVAPTVANLFGLSLPNADGRPLLEALSTNGVPLASYTVNASTVAPTPASGLAMKLPTDPTGNTIDAGKSTYTIQLQTKNLSYGGKTFTYFDYAKALRR